MTWRTKMASSKTKKKSTPKRVMAVPIVKIGASIGGELKEFAVEPNDTIARIFEKARISVGNGVEVLCRQTAEVVALDSTPLDGYVYYASQKLKSQ